jgi:AraC-like DNA-binding protein
LELLEITPISFKPIANTPPQYLSEKNEEKPTIETKQADENIIVLANKVDDFLCKNRTFINPNLSLNDLAQKLKMQPHLLSKVINDGFNKNFFDFINGYRIEEFKKLTRDKRYKHHTFVSLAFEVGSNSKTAFNQSFKKMTGQTPREYLSQLGIEAFI